jgi:alpha-beta hydrolase superfamily lysophospholipase
MHALARRLSAAGNTVYALDMRGHGASSPGGDIGYVGQMDDDMVDCVAFIRRAHPAARLTLLGFSSGGGFALRIAGGPYGSLFDRYVLLAPYLRYDAPTVRPGTIISVTLY